MNTDKEVPVDLMEHVKMSAFNMNEIVGTKDIVFLCYDSLRYDVAVDMQEKGLTPNINQYGMWQKRHASGNFTYPSHHAMFSGFLPIPYECNSIFEHESLFFPRDIGLGHTAPKNSFCFEGSTFVEGLYQVGYETICIGGVGFFNKRSAIGKVFPNMFSKSYWRPSFGCPVENSTDNQFDFALEKLSEYEKEKRVFMYINITAIHYPTYFYVEGKKRKPDNLESHANALRYVDACIPKIIKGFEERGGCFVIACSDHGTCLGEDGKMFHGMNNDIVNIVPYMEFNI